MNKVTNKDQVLVLAYSGGLDTSFCIPYLKEKGFTIHAVSVDTGGFTQDDKTDMKKRAYQLGADHYDCIDISEAYYINCIRYMVFGNMLRGDTYPMSVSSERAFQAMAILRYVKKVNASFVAHGSTGAGNDQVRFDIIFQSLAPDVKIITPIRDNAFSRDDEVQFLEEKGFSWSEEKKDYSINKGIWGTSVGGKETLTSDRPLPDSAYPVTVSANRKITIDIGFRRGELISIDGQTMTPLEAIKCLEQIAAPYGIGRDIHVGDTIIGIKGRVGFQAAAPILIIKAHQLLEKHTLGKWQAYWKKQLADWYGMQLHEGQYLDPVMRDIESFLEQSQKNVNGIVRVRLVNNSFVLEGVTSPNDLMNSEFGNYGEENKAWSGEDVKGFSKILSNSHRIFYSVNQTEKL